METFNYHNSTKPCVHGTLMPIISCSKQVNAGLIPIFFF